ncbi:MAG: alanine:cation symporter family protein [Proteobacteria bacterium]|nr:alanine:cation symporter family protein [Pseudomonadota bacterium]
MTFPLVVIWLIAGALFFTIYMKFINLRGFRQSLRIVSGKYDNPKDPGEVTHFQALSAALSGTVGLGNIAGVAIAISVGGPGATFWMILAGFLGMTSKFVECTLGVKYREIDENGVVSGGPMYYLSKGLAKRGLVRLGVILAALSALSVIGGAVGSGAFFQVNQAAAQFINVVVPLTGGENSVFFQGGWIFGIVYAFFVGLIIIGGIKKISHVTEFLVPIMAFIYVGAALVILFTHAGQIPEAFIAIFKGAFSPDGITGGFIGVIIIGIQRATFSNEAGLGSAPIAHAAAKTKEPVAEGLVALLEPFIDTVVVCTMTALVIIIVGGYEGATEGITLTSRAFASVISWFPYVLMVAAILFAFSTSITWYYYGERSFVYLSNNSGAVKLAYKISFIAALIIGSSMTLNSIFDFAAAMLFAMAIPNMIGLYIMAPEVRRMLKSYLARVKSGEIKAVK